MTQKVSANIWYLYLDIEDWFRGCSMNIQNLLKDAGTALMNIDSGLAQRCIASVWRSTADRIDELMFDIRFVLEQFLSIH